MLYSALPFIFMISVCLTFLIEISRAEIIIELINQLNQKQSATILIIYSCHFSSTKDNLSLVLASQI